jgi:hypothetical protein
LLDGVRAFFFTVNTSRPRYVFVSGSVFTTQVIVNEYAETFMIVTQERVCTRFTSDSQCLACRIEWQRQNGHGLKCRGMFGQRSVM